LNLDGKKPWTALFIEESWAISQLVSPLSSGHEHAKPFKFDEFQNNINK
jgi:hypothetical protein